MKEGKCKIEDLRKGCFFMFQCLPYKVIRTYKRNIGLFKQKVWVCKCKFEEQEFHWTSGITVYKISKGLYNILEKNSHGTDKVLSRENLPLQEV